MGQPLLEKRLSFIVRRLPGTAGTTQGDMLELPSDTDKATASTNTPATDHTPAAASPKGSNPRAQSPKVQSKDRDMGAALRSAYQRTVDESVPDDLLDLLNKLA